VATQSALAVKLLVAKLPLEKQQALQLVHSMAQSALKCQALQIHV
jgi:hypothetical protein